MKKIAFLLLLGALPLGFAACDLFDKLEEIEFSATLEDEVDISISASGTNVTFSNNTTLDALDNPDIAEYSDKLKGFTVESVKFTITNLTGEANSVLTGTFGVYKVGATNPIATVDLDLNLTEANTAGTVYELNLTSADYTAINNALNEDKAIKLTSEGTLSKAPVSFTINYAIDVKVKADVLN